MVLGLLLLLAQAIWLLMIIKFLDCAAVHRVRCNIIASITLFSFYYGSSYCQNDATSLHRVQHRLAFNGNKYILMRTNQVSLRKRVMGNYSCDVAQ